MRQVPERVQRAMEAANSTGHSLTLIIRPPRPASPRTGLCAYHPLITPIGIVRPHSRMGTVDLGRRAMIGSPRPLPSQAAAQPGASRLNPLPFRHPMQLIPGEPPVSRAKKSPPRIGGQRAHISFAENESLRSPSSGMKSALQKSWLLSLEVMQRGVRLTTPTMVFSGREAPHFASPHNDPMVVEMKVASAIVQRILIDTGSSVDIITWDCLMKLTYPGRDIVPLVHPILGIGGQEVNPTGMMHLLLCFGDKLMARNMEVVFLVVDVPAAYNVILGRPALHRTKALSWLPGELLSPRDGTQPRLLPARAWRPHSQWAPASPLLTLHKIKKKPIPRLPIVRFAPLPLRPLYRLYHLGYELGNGPRAILLPYIVRKVSSHFLLLVGRLFEAVPDWLLFIPTRKVPLTQVSTNEEEVVLSISPLTSFQRPSSWPVVKAIPPKVPCLLGSPLNGMDQAERSSCTCQAA
ncbi:LOW QUALITY PROTEIN: hypothetical protein Cgig2_021675 [Carnegiea gigantea]|uniref:Peptidase A2 domain-containing protein n=1 Tax=Carnegiea gigantea TaxID=171969 RepID=A0A9Q1KUS9_9CARY|nr:LOW QUALITY PROTEIN: hypothetical protein Cgig2_021675 [Carnegiea gigantea]